jgi:serine/threonine protein kinase
MNLGDIIVQRYQVLSKLGQGKFGIVFHGRNIKNNSFVAIKTESTSSSIRLLKNETTILKYLYDEGCRCTPIVYWYGIHFDNSCLITSYYKITLYDYLHMDSITQEKKDKIMRTCISMLESVHKYLVIHRDIKPQNFMIRDGELFLIDFGLSTFYIDSKGNHIQDVISDNLIGTPKYISYNLHCGHTASRRDDMLSLGYMYLWLCNGELPWDFFNLSKNYILQRDDEKVSSYSGGFSEPQNIYRKEKKSWNMLENLFINNKQLTKIYRYLDYCYHLDYESSPLYGELEKIFPLDNQESLDNNNKK